MDFSIIICTYNRSKSLPTALNSLNSLNLPDNFQWEVIIVDNNSTDNTKEVVDEFIENSKLNLRYVKETQQGLSHARNKGIKESKGKYIAFTDDDTIVDSQWIARLHETFQEYGCDCVGGRIYIKPEKELPRWLKKELWGFLGFLDYGDKLLEIKDEKIFGGNMVFSKEILSKTGYFNTELGRTLSALTGGEEAELIQKIKNLGGTIMYQPSAIVHHVIGPEKLNKQYFRKLHYYSGVISGRFFNKPIKRHINGIPLFVFPHFLKSIINYLKFPCVKLQMNVWWHLGFMIGRAIEHKNQR